MSMMAEQDIGTYLRGIAKSRLPIFVDASAFGGRIKIFLLGIDEDKGTFKFSEPIGYDKKLPLLTKPIYVSFTVKDKVGGEMFFQSRCQGGVDGVYLADIPKTIARGQKREWYRALVPGHIESEAAFYHQGQCFAKGRIVDISVTGIGVILGDEYQEKAASLQGQTLKVTAFIDEYVNLSAMVLLNSVFRKDDQWRIGASFVNWDPVAERNMEQVAAALERLSLKSKNR